MSSDTLIYEPPLHPHSYESSNADHNLDESDDAATTINSEIQSGDGNLGRKKTMPTGKSIPSKPSRLEHRTQMGSVLEWVQNIQPQGDSMSKEVVLESHPILICLQLLRPAILLLPEPQQALSVKPSNPIREPMAGNVGGCKENIAIMEDTVDAFFNVDVDIIGALTLKGFADRLGVCEAYIIHGLIFGGIGLLETMRGLRMDCRDSGHVQSLSTTLRYAAATIYADFFECCIEVLCRQTGGINTS
ncbi:hypothetical protein Forpe1208_v012349 [Fusarium oxysporum f. sp. rapae]|uniref:Uncharacterized protein n=1 Tax=Fusarium oxysporum f. sp. rapae TaxID=485398 RepID=A0A8J5NNP5_FUSOX|nr:hypothetical protein Forpe1208_v012349 [Fusarium oxysporum f. sp. rapae]